MCLRRSAPGGHVICQRGLGTERKCGSHHAAWSAGRIRCKSEGEVMSAKEVEGEAVFAEKREGIRAWPSGPPGQRLCPLVFAGGVNNPPTPRARANSGGRRVARYPAWLLASRATVCAWRRVCVPVRITTRRHLPQHFIRYQRLAGDQVPGARQVLHTQTQRNVQGHWRPRCINGARIGGHHACGVGQSRVDRTSHAAVKQFHRYFVQNEVLQHVERALRPDPRRRHDSCLWSG
jgi:hypothetical protein